MIDVNTMYFCLFNILNNVLMTIVLYKYKIGIALLIVIYV